MVTHCGATGSEEISHVHSLYAQLREHREPDVLEVHFYASATHQGLHYYEGRGVIWEHEEQGTVLGQFVQAVECHQKYYLICQLYHHFLNGSPFQSTSDGIPFVHPSMLTGKLLLVPLVNVGNLLPCLYVEEGDKLLIVPATA